MLDVHEIVDMDEEAAAEFERPGYVHDLQRGLAGLEPVAETDVVGIEDDRSRLEKLVMHRFATIAALVR